MIFIFIFLFLKPSNFVIIYFFTATVFIRKQSGNFLIVFYSTVIANEKAKTNQTATIKSVMKVRRKGWRQLETEWEGREGKGRGAKEAVMRWNCWLSFQIDRMQFHGLLNSFFFNSYSFLSFLPVLHRYIRKKG